ncbi:MAG: rod shape-determining protein [Candidatus Dormibacteraeota bacterium]|nr:rod shape-determining protein [Candidatus Dormibacteraeota bacterium]
MFKKIGVDLGSERLRVYVRGEGLILDAPAAVAVSGPGPAVIGDAAVRLEGHTGVHVVWPVAAGVLTDVRAASLLVEHAIAAGQGHQRLFRPEVVVCVPPATGLRERWILTAAMVQAGPRQAWLIDGPLAAAIGAGLPVAERRACAVCDLGGGSVEVALLARSGMIVWRGAALALDGTGRTEAVAGLVRRTVAEAPDQVAAEVLADGLTLTGGGALQPGVAAELAALAGLPVRAAEDPHICAARGAAQAPQRFEVMRSGQAYIR